MSDVCALKPIVQGKPSMLWEGLYKTTGKNRRLTNLLYAIAIQDSVKNQFDKKSLNSQGELNLRDFLNKFNIKHLIDSKQSINADKVSIGAVDNNGVTVTYDDPEDIRQKVIDYNNSHEGTKAQIKYKNGGFYIDIDTLGSDNFDVNASMLGRKAIFDTILNELAAHGFNKNLSAETLKKYNFLSSYSLLQGVKGMIRYNKNNQSGFRYSPEQSMLLLDLMRDSSNAGRSNSDILINNLGLENAALLIAKTSGYEVEIPQQLQDELDNNPNLVNRANNLISSARHLFALIDEDDFSSKAEEARNNATSALSREVIGVGAEEIKKTLKSLCDKWHINQEAMDAFGSDVKSLSDAARTFLMTRLREYEVARKKTGVKQNDDELKKLKKMIDNGLYAESIATFLDDLNNDLTSFSNELDVSIDSFNSEGTSLSTINKVSGAILRALELHQSYYNIVNTLREANTLDLDELNLPSGLIDDIKAAADSAEKVLSHILRVARDKQFDTVYAFSKLYWGNEDEKRVGNETFSLAAILKNAVRDIGMLDRFTYSMNETSDPAMGIIYEAVKMQQRRRDKILREGQFIIRDLTEKLFQSSDTRFMYVMKDGLPTGRIRSNYDWVQYEENLRNYENELKEKHLVGKKYDEARDKWIMKHTKRLAASDNAIYKQAVAEYAKRLYGDNAQFEDYNAAAIVPYYMENGKNKYETNDLDSLTQAQQEYYYKMLALKAVLTVNLPMSEEQFYLAPQISSSFTNALSEAGGNPERVWKMAKNKFMDLFVRREDDDEYGSFDDLLELNGMRRAIADVNGHELMRLPIFFTHRLKDTSRLSTDYSRGMSAIMATSVNYEKMNEVLDALLNMKEYLMNVRKIGKTAGSDPLVDVFNWGREMYMNSIKKEAGTSATAGLLTDFYEKAVFGRKKKVETIKGIPIDKIADVLTGYTSITGLTVNLLGAEANYLVGKMQMIIEGACGEFYNLSDLSIADVKYFQMLPELLVEASMGNNRKSKLALLMERFDVLEDYYRDLKAKGFYKSPIGKIIGNSNMFFMYGAGEHALHAVTMLAILQHTKVYDVKAHTDIPLLEAIDVDLTYSKKNGKLKLDRDSYKWIEKDDKGNVTHRDITDEDILKVEKNITYANKSMHGTYNDLDKGMIHRYAIGRMIMNFRQWMPAHYGRRFRGLHYDADLGEFRRGFYTSLWNFLWETVKEIKNSKLQIATRWNELSDMDKYNLKRVIAETAMFAMLTVSNLSLGRYKDKKGNWAARMLAYEVKRMLMETQASSPLVMPFSGYGATGFIKNFISVLNSPMACLSSIDKIATILDLTNLFSEVENGKHRGENLYLHNLEKSLPFYGSIRKQLNMGEEDYLFNVFKQAGQAN